MELKSVQNVDRINIIDVLKPQQDEETTLDEQVTMENTKYQEESDTTQVSAVTEDVTSIALDTDYQASHFPSLNTGMQATTTIGAQHLVASPLAVPIKQPYGNRMSCKMPTNNSENITRWVMDGNFRKEQERLKIPLGIFNTHF